jgi:hypothetical protein
MSGRRSDIRARFQREAYTTSCMIYIPSGLGSVKQAKFFNASNSARTKGLHDQTPAETRRDAPIRRGRCAGEDRWERRCLKGR